MVLRNKSAIMKKYRLLLTILFTLPAFIQTYCQETLAEKLGYPKDSKLLIIHADDVGLSHSEDSATISALEKKAVNSASIMVPCPWFNEIAVYARQHPEMDWGIHLTFTSEWKNYKWGGIASSKDIPSLLDKSGYLYASNEEMAKYATPADVEKEAIAQIDKAIAAGIKVTHIDNHMGSILASPGMVHVYEKLGKKYHMPVLVPVNYIRLVAPSLIKDVDTNAIFVVNNFGMAYPGIPVDKWKQFYIRFIQNLKPGLNELIFHLAYNDVECSAITTGHPDYGAAWRQRDFDCATSDELKTALGTAGVHLVTWGEIQKVIAK
jgi:chitin disaccharide deacetylase